MNLQIEGSFEKSYIFYIVDCSEFGLNWYICIEIIFTNIILYSERHEKKLFRRVIQFLRDRKIVFWLLAAHLA